MFDLIALLWLFSFPILVFVFIAILTFYFITLAFKCSEIKLIKKDEKDMKF